MPNNILDNFEEKIKKIRKQYFFIVEYGLMLSYLFFGVYLIYILNTFGNSAVEPDFRTFIVSIFLIGFLGIATIGRSILYIFNWMKFSREYEIKLDKEEALVFKNANEAFPKRRQSSYITALITLVWSLIFALLLFGKSDSWRIALGFVFLALGHLWYLNLIDKIINKIIQEK